jgi:hypothetical protein
MVQYLAMNLLAEVSWNTVALEEPELFEGSSIRYIDVLHAARRRGLIDPRAVDDVFELEDAQPAIADLTRNCRLVISDEDWHRLAAAPRGATDLPQSETWLEAHYLGKGRYLLLPGEGSPMRTLSFWSSPTVTSFIVNGCGRITAFMRHRRKQCQEDPDSPTECIGMPDGCICTAALSYNGRIVTQECQCVG